MGNGYSVHPDSHNLLLVAGGIGIAPLCFLAEEALNQGHPVTLLLGAATGAQLYHGDLLPDTAELVIATEDGTTGKKGMITDLLPDFTRRADQIFACGPASMYRAMATHSQQFPKLKSAQISLEMRMGCGLGICYGCTLRTKGGLKQVCKDGPVFELNDIIWSDPAFSL
jgi:dihydroorotate dehydrogenase electron transfer subunit